MFEKTDMVYNNISVFLADDEFLDYLREYTEGASSIELEDLYEVYEEFMLEGQD